jgi:hypothetical protein
MVKVNGTLFFLKVIFILVTPDLAFFLLACIDV